MRKIAPILFLTVLLSGCYVSRKEKTNISELPVQGETGILLELVKEGNISRNNFFIQKADVELKYDAGKRRFICTIKYKKPGNYLISIKNITGIEIARMFLSEDSIFINDRINRKLYKGSSEYFKNKYGVSSSVLPVIFGDFVSDTLLESSYKVKDEAISSLIGEALIMYFVNARINKVIKAIHVYNSRDDAAILNFKKFHIFNNIAIPQYVEIQINKRNLFVKLKIRKVQIPWEGNLEFIPGNKYEIIDLK